MQCMDRASLEQLLDQGLSLAEIGRRFGLHEATVGYWVKKHGLRAVNRESMPRVVVWPGTSWSA
jgi:transposase-like protein